MVDTTYPGRMVLAKNWGITLSSHLLKSAVYGTAAVAVSGAIALSDAAPSPAAISGVINN
ncbi:hypothetical protein ACTAQJ_16430 [Arthrobacter sp. alpha11c]